ncbi:MAG: arginine deiminase-related protein [Sphingomonadales bacterium]
MKEHLASTVVMIRPAHFGFNPETEGSNTFQKRIPELSRGEVQEMALHEFDRFVAALKWAGVEVLVFDDSEVPETPDVVFPNNWFATHPNGPLLTFPLESPTRRGERRDDILEMLQKDYGYTLERALEAGEGDGHFLEGTGSLVLDHKNKIAYAALSSRTLEAALGRYARLSGYQPVAFSAYGPEGEPIYHTNVILCLGPDFAILGADTIDAGDRGRILDLLEKSGKTVLKLTNEQIFEHFAGNMLCLASKSGQRLLVMSKTANLSLTAAQRKTIEEDFACRIVSSAIPTIERVGGGSARCMLAEVFTP